MAVEMKEEILCQEDCKHNKKGKCTNPKPNIKTGCFENKADNERYEGNKLWECDMYWKGYHDAIEEIELKLKTIKGTAKFLEGMVERGKKEAEKIADNEVWEESNSYY